MPPFKHEEPVLGAAFNAGGSRVLTFGSFPVRLWDIAVDSTWPADKVVLKTEVDTGTTLETNGSLNILFSNSWQEKKWCEYDAIRFRLKRINEEQWRTSQRLCRAIKEKNTKYGTIQMPYSPV